MVSYVSDQVVKPETYQEVAERCMPSYLSVWWILELFSSVGLYKALGISLLKIKEMTLILIEVNNLDYLQWCVPKLPTWCHVFPCWLSYCTDISLLPLSTEQIYWHFVPSLTTELLYWHLVPSCYHWTVVLPFRSIPLPLNYCTDI
jgi:hypothetical protein